MKVVYSEQFRAELCCVTGRYNLEGEDLARRFVQSVENAALEVQSDPFRWRLLDGRVRRCLVRRFPYILCYLVEDDVLFFGALLHSARDPGAYQ